MGPWYGRTDLDSVGAVRLGGGYRVRCRAGGETVVGISGGGLSTNASPAKMASVLHEHHERLLVIAYLSVVYAATFVIYLCSLYNLLRGEAGRSRSSAPWYSVAECSSSLCTLSATSASRASSGRSSRRWVSKRSGRPLHAVSDDVRLDSVGDVFGSLFAFAAGLLVLRSGVLPRWLGWGSILVGVLFFLQAFGLGGVIASFGFVLDLIGFVLFLIFVFVSSVILLTRESAPSPTPRLGIEWPAECTCPPLQPQA